MKPRSPLHPAWLAVEAHSFDRRPIVFGVKVPQAALRIGLTVTITALYQGSFILIMRFLLHEATFTIATRVAGRRSPLVRETANCIRCQGPSSSSQNRPNGDLSLLSIKAPSY